MHPVLGLVSMDDLKDHLEGSSQLVEISHRSSFNYHPASSLPPTKAIWLQALGQTVPLGLI